LPVNLKIQDSKRVKGFDDGEVNKQSVTKIESFFSSPDPKVMSAIAITWRPSVNF
jgi:hypothetical protein